MHHATSGGATIGSPVFIHGFEAEEDGHFAAQISVIGEVGVVTIFNFEP